MQQHNIHQLTFEGFSQYLIERGEKTFRATQVFEWLYKRGVSDFDAMSNLSEDLRRQLKKDFYAQELSIAQEQKSSDGTQKILFELKDKEQVETVIIPTSQRVTVCVSTQVGCKFGCTFCASGIGGWKRNLSCAEIMEQILYAKASFKKASFSHIVFMGVGEPLDNYENLLKAIRLINSSKGIHIAARRITISTSGLVPGIKKFAGEGLQVELSISLHAPNDEIRSRLMPINKRYPLTELIQTCHAYVKTTKRQITFEYILIKDVTCHEKAAKELGRLLKGLLCKMNLIVYNEVKEFDYRRPSRQEVLAFQNQLKREGIHSTLRTPRGRDIAAACGQLRHQEK